MMKIFEISLCSGDACGNFSEDVSLGLFEYSSKEAAVQSVAKTVGWGAYKYSLEQDAYCNAFSAFRVREVKILRPDQLKDRFEGNKDKWH